MYPYLFYRPRYPNPYYYPMPNPYLLPYLYGSYQSQQASINQNLYNAGVMAGVTQSAINNNFMY